MGFSSSSDGWAIELSKISMNEQWVSGSLGRQKESHSFPTHTKQLLSLALAL